MTGLRIVLYSCMAPGCWHCVLVSCCRCDSIEISLHIWCIPQNVHDSLLQTGVLGFMSITKKECLRLELSAIYPCLHKMQLDADAQKRWECAELHAPSMIAALETCPWLASKSCQQSDLIGKDVGKECNQSRKKTFVQIQLPYDGGLCVDNTLCIWVNLMTVKGLSVRCFSADFGTVRLCDNVWLMLL